MLKVIIPLDHSEERQYIINILFAEFLGLDITINKAESLLASIQLDNGNILEIEDGFFNKFKPNENYLQEKNIPSTIFSLDLENSPEKSILGLYGAPKITFTANKIKCDVDLFASAFFMLTRWEEYVITDRDSHGRFPAKSSLAYKHNFLDRPIVNEYVEVLWHWLKKLGIKQSRKVRNFEFINTHDIDKIKLFEHPRDYLVKPIKGLITEKKPSSFIRHAKLAMQSLKGNDPYDVYDFFMDSSEKHNIKSHFFFMAASSKTRFDNGYDITSKPIKDIIKNVINRGHVVGIHPSYMTLNNPALLSAEINALRDITKTDIVCGRQHYLRFDLPNTWQHWDDNKMQWDSSLAYSEHEGFRCGVCYSFPVFNILSRKTLKLKEKPLIIMDGTLQSSRGLSPHDSTEVISYYLNVVKKYSGEFVFLWHNSSFDYLFWKDYKQVYESAFSSCHR